MPLIETCKLNAIDPEAYLAWLFGKLAHPRRLADVDELLPWAYAAPLKATRAVSAAA
ncbi:transposase domain-containing protein [Vineibacter terrae]|uniref:transposase domain-containing protein n=1 Tax=Vineibacter terrae TaxID=2586908 RepID=UPI0015B5EB27